MGYPIGRSGFTLSAVMIRPKNKVRAELYISGEEAKGFLASLKGQRGGPHPLDRFSLRLRWNPGS